MASPSFFIEPSKGGSRATLEEKRQGAARRRWEALQAERELNDLINPWSEPCTSISSDECTTNSTSPSNP